MWQCVKCGEKLEDRFTACWKCGTSRDGTEDPTFRKADDSRPPETGGQAPAEASAEELAPRAGGSAVAPPPEFEFTPRQNEAFAGLASAMRDVGVCAIILGVLQMLTVASGNLTGLISGVIFLLIGIWTNSAAASFRKIVDTQGRDITNLMEAVRSLRSLYNFQRILILIGLILVAAVLLAALIVVPLGGWR